MELGRSVLLELAAKPDLDVHVGVSYRSAALELGVDCQVSKFCGIVIFTECVAF
jgi:hypothetical protein